MQSNTVSYRVCAAVSFTASSLNSIHDLQYNYAAYIIPFILKCSERACSVYIHKQTPRQIDQLTRSGFTGTAALQICVYEQVS